MGTFKIKVEVSNVKDPALYFEEEFWVDTGALYSFIPENYLERIGVEAGDKTESRARRWSKGYEIIGLL